MFSNRFCLGVRFCTFAGLLVAALHSGLVLAQTTAPAVGAVNAPCLKNPANGVYQLCVRFSPNRECRQWTAQCGTTILSAQELQALNEARGCLRFFADGNCQEWSTPPGCVYDTANFMFRVCTAQQAGTCTAMGDRCPGR